MNEHAANLKEHLGRAFNFPPHLHDAFSAWIDSVEERMRAQAGPPRRRGEPSVEDRVAAVETSVADLHAALSEKPSPATVQRAVADVEVPQPDAKKD